MHSQTSQPGQRRDNNKGHNKYQKKYVPKANDSASTTKLNEGKGEPNGSQNHDESRSGSLTSSLRQSSEKVNYRTGGQGGKIKQNDGSRRQVWRSGGSNEKSLPKKQGNYVKYLPQDDAVATGLGVEDGGIDVVETQGIADLLNQELRSLLRMKPREFWREVATDGSLHEFLDSYLRFRKRWYDLPDCRQSGSMAGLVVGDQELSRRVFMVLYRMSSNHDPGAHASECLSSKEHTDLLWGKKLLDIPKLMDISAIYGCDNADLTRSLARISIPTCLFLFLCLSLPFEMYLQN